MVRLFLRQCGILTKISMNLKIKTMTEEFFMKNTKILLTVLAIALVFGMTACKNDGVDPALEGEWVWENENELFINFNNGMFAKNDMEGTYTAKDGKFTMRPIRILLLLDDNWYTKEGALEKFPDDTKYINDEFSPLTGTYSVGDTLTLTFKEGPPFTYIRK